MARSVRVGEFQRMQRGPQHVGLTESEALGETAQNGHDVAAVDPMTGGLVDADSRPPGFRSPPLTVPEQLAVLVLQDDISGMPLGQVVGLVRMAVAKAHVNAVESEIRDEAERRVRLVAADEEDQPEPSDTMGYCNTCGDPIRRDEEQEILKGGIRVHQACAAEETATVELKPDDQAEPHGRYAYTDADHENRIEDKRRQEAFAALGPNVHGIGPDTDHGPNPDYDRAADVAAQLQRLGVELLATAEWSLSMIVSRISTAAIDMDPYPSEEEIDVEANRIWRSFDENRAGPREATVAPDGTLHDWRRPDATPDRGPDVGTTHHTVSDETRFSGAGAEDVPFTESSKLVPEDRAFNGRLYRDAPELANIAERLIGEHGFLEGLVNCEIKYYWRRKTGVSKGRVKIGYCKRASDLLGHFSNADFIIWLSATTARDGKFTDRQIEAAVFHQLLHIETDDEGNFISARHDFEGFAQEITHYGVWTADLKTLVPAVTAAQQMGLFDASDEDDDESDGSDLDCRNCGGTVSMERPLTGGLCEACVEEQAEERHRADGSGVLIHDDGTLLTDDEIEAMEQRELDDAPADPDQPYDEDADPLADHDL